MIIKLPLMLHNIVSKQFKISHVPCDVIAFKKEEIPSNILKLIEDQYDEKFLEDCDTVLFIKGPIDKELRKKIFKACDKALGEGANMMNETDFRLLKLNDDEDDFGGENDQTDEEKIDSQVADIVNEPDDDTDEDDIDNEAEDNGDAVEKSLASESLEDNSIMSAVVQGKSIRQWVDAFKGEFTGNQLWKMANSGTDLQRLLLTITGNCTLDDSELNEAESSDEDSNDKDSKEDKEEEDSDFEDDEEEDNDSEEDDKDVDSGDDESEEDEEEPVVPTRYVFLKISMKG